MTASWLCLGLTSPVPRTCIRKNPIPETFFGQISAVLLVALAAFISGTNRHHRSQTLVNLPNLMIKRQDKTPIAWALLGTDGSLISVHVEVSSQNRQAS